MNGIVFSAPTIAVIAIAVLGASGCGGGGGGSAPPDTTPPNVVSTDPPDNAVGVQLMDPITITFDELIDPASVTGSTFVVRNDTGTAISGNVNASGRTARFNPANNALIKSALYQATVSGIRDSAGNTLAADFVWDFTTTTDQWQPTNTSSAPSARFDHTAVWANSEMIVWGGADTGQSFRNGGRYQPSTNTWGSVTMTDAPTARNDHTAVWTGSEMIVWGGNAPAESGLSNTGGRYTPSPTGGSWIATTPTNAPLQRAQHSAVWTGSEMIVWGGNIFGGQVTNTGGRFNPSGADTWLPTSTSSAPLPRNQHTAVWTGTEMIVWGGLETDLLQLSSSGGRYRPASNSWLSVSAVNAPTPRAGHTAVWTGTEMIIWGGGDAFLTNTGARYNPSTNSWAPMTATNAPLPREGHTAIWTGSEMLVWGGHPSSNLGHAYNPSTDRWRMITTIDAPTARTDHTAVWTGTRMIVWGGIDTAVTNSGGRYAP
jgi:N-acetylneuraminic acid mutarotase